MTRMMQIFEEYLAYKSYKYIRLDGSTTIESRREMVQAWQTNPEIFIFMLSTRAGGLGLNLTSADTVIFYDSDWNQLLIVKRWIELIELVKLNKLKYLDWLLEILLNKNS